MLQFMSVIMVSVIFSGAVGFIVMTIRQSSASVVRAIVGSSVTPVERTVQPRRVIRQVPPLISCPVPLRAAA